MPGCVHYGHKSKIQNQKPESRNQKPETRNQNPQIKENKFFKYWKIVLLRFLPVKNKWLSKKDLKLKQKFPIC